MFGIGTPELLVILLVALIVLGPKRLPGVARAIGRGMRELRRAMHSFEDFVDEQPSEPRSDPSANPSVPPLENDEPSAEAKEDEAADKGKP